jgi:hypothetical protein
MENDLFSWSEFLENEFWFDFEETKEVLEEDGESGEETKNEKPIKTKKKKQKQIGKPKKKKYSEEALRRAFEEVKDVMSKGKQLNLSKIAKKWGVPRNTLTYRLSKPSGIVCGKELSELEEMQLVRLITSKQKTGEAFTKDSFIQEMNGYLREIGTKFTVGERFYQAFKKRHPEICLRRGKAIEKERLEAQKGIKYQWIFSKIT